MAMQLGALRDALVEAGASPATAGKASEELAGYSSELSDIRSDLKFLKATTAINTAIGIAVLLKLFIH
jgi:hypothetical protein